MARDHDLGDALLLGQLALAGGTELVHVAATRHRGRVAVLTAGVGIHLRVQQDDLQVGTILQHGLGQVLEPDVAQAAVATHDPHARQFVDLAGS